MTEGRVTIRSLRLFRGPAARRQDFSLNTPEVHTTQMFLAQRSLPFAVDPINWRNDNSEDQIVDPCSNGCELLPRIHMKSY